MIKDIKTKEDNMETLELEFNSNVEKYGYNFNYTTRLLDIVRDRLKEEREFLNDEEYKEIFQYELEEEKKRNTRNEYLPTFKLRDSFNKELYLSPYSIEDFDFRIKQDILGIDLMGREYRQEKKECNLTINTTRQDAEDILRYITNSSYYSFSSKVEDRTINFNCYTSYQVEENYFNNDIKIYLRLIER